MEAMTAKDDYALLKSESQSSAFRSGSRTESAGLLAWFLTNFWLLEPEEVDDAICDGGGDKGIDALVVDDETGDITLFQAKHHKKAGADQGDKDLKNLFGAAKYFDTIQAVDGLLASKPNAELTRLLHRTAIRDRVADGSSATRLVFVTDGVLDASGRSYAESVASVSPPMEIWDLTRLAPIAARTKAPALLPGKHTIRCVAPCGLVALTPDTPMAVGIAKAKDLLNRLPGIDNLSIFHWNVRLSEGKTRINRELAKTVSDAGEHSLFPAYHNGLTLVTNSLSVRGKSMTLDGVSVVNGCQSLLTLFENSTALTDDLTVLVKVVQVDSNNELTDKITYRTNNQNPVDMRDQRSSDRKQRDLKASVNEDYPTTFAFAIRQGEQHPDGVPVFDNRQAAQLLMAVYLKQPWLAVRKVRLFDQDYRRIFDRHVDSHRLHFLWRLDSVVVANKAKLTPDLQAGFASIRLALAHLTAELLRESPEGSDLLAAPERWLPDLDAEVFAKVSELVGEAIESLHGYIQNEEIDRKNTGEDFDPKVHFKSERGVSAATTEVLRMARRLAVRDSDYFFNIAPKR